MERKRVKQIVSQGGPATLFLLLGFAVYCCAIYTMLLLAYNSLACLVGFFFHGNGGRERGRYHTCIVLCFHVFCNSSLLCNGDVVHCLTESTSLSYDGTLLGYTWHSTARIFSTLK
ncbi:hypothetical protein OCU04_003527 [Sclerotinia nivalis]|uniref:Uncharacterized protein n=1 Tax=Sclerotinia nivalis TaxID=352851 RepID=A0A9X0ASI2_9HELO|nr:hypothetical protein OCU04_003527 [Sclerotinia nivalis]